MQLIPSSLGWLHYILAHDGCARNTSSIQTELSYRSKDRFDGNFIAHFLCQIFGRFASVGTSPVLSCRSEFQLCQTPTFDKHMSHRSTTQWCVSVEIPSPPPRKKKVLAGSSLFTLTFLRVHNIFVFFDHISHNRRTLKTKACILFKPLRTFVNLPKSYNFVRATIYPPPRYQKAKGHS